MIYNCRENFLQFDLNSLKILAEEWAKEYGVVCISLHETLNVNNIYDVGSFIVWEVADSNAEHLKEIHLKKVYVEGVCQEDERKQLRIVAKDIEKNFPEGISDKISYLLYRDKVSELGKKVNSNIINLIIKYAGPEIVYLYQSMNALSPNMRPKTLQQTAMKFMREHSGRFFVIKEDHLLNTELFKLSKKHRPEYFKKKMLHMIINRLGFGPIKKEACIERYNQIFNIGEPEDLDLANSLYGKAWLMWLVDENPFFALDLYDSQKIKVALVQAVNKAKFTFNKLKMQGLTDEDATDKAIEEITGKPAVATKKPGEAGKFCCLTKKVKEEILKSIGFNTRK